MLTIKQLLGQWKLVDSEMTVGDKTDNTFDKNRTMIKLFTPTHFSFYSKTANRLPFSAKITDDERLAACKTLDTGGGRYELLNNEYTEHIEYCSYPNYEGKSLQFRLSLDNNTLIQEGPYPLKLLGFGAQDGYVKEVYVRVD